MAGKAQRKPRNRSDYNYGDYLKWSGPERWELVDGEIFPPLPPKIVAEPPVVYI